jgi:aminomethyltransferase
LGSACHLVGYDFPGRDALVEIQRHPLNFTRVAIELPGRRVARGGCPILHAGVQVGEVTSGTFGPTVEKAIAMGYVRPEHAAPGTELNIDVRGRLEPARVVKLPFYRRQSRRNGS